MSSLMNVSCPICKIIFSNADAIYSTSCGHLFHFQCLNSWKCSSSSSCPQCRECNPTSHRLYLNFDESNDCQKQLEISKLKNASLETELEQAKIRFIEFRSQKDRITKVHESQIENQKKVINDLETQLQTIKDSTKWATEKLEKENLDLAAENAELKESLESNEVGSSDAILRAKLKVVEQKLSIISKELEKEVSNSTQLSIDNIKLQSSLRHLESDLSRSVKEGKNEADDKQLSRKEIIKNTENGRTKPIKEKIVPANAVIIENFSSSSHDRPPLKEFVARIAVGMNLTLPKEQMKLVYIKQIKGQKYKPVKLQLIVEFKSLDWKLKFICNKDRLKYHPQLNRVEINEFGDENTQTSLFKYANTQLRGKIFEYIALKSNTVIAKKKLQDNEEINITSRQQVDDLLKQDQDLKKSLEKPANPRNRFTNRFTKGLPAGNVDVYDEMFHFGQNLGYNDQFIM